MSKPLASKQCDIFTHRQKTSTKTTTPSPQSNTEMNMASMEEVLNELKSLRVHFGIEMDNIDNRLTSLVNSVTALENKATEVKQDVSANAVHFEEVDGHIH